MGIGLTLFYCNTGDLELDSFEARSTELRSPSSSECTGMEMGSTECGSTESESSGFVSSEYESTELETVLSGHIEDVPLRQWWSMNDDRLLAILYGSRCVLTDEFVPRNSFLVMRTHPVLVSLANYFDHESQCRS